MKFSILSTPLALLLGFLPYISKPSILLAQETEYLGTITGLGPLSPILNTGNNQGSICGNQLIVSNTLNLLISMLIGFLTILAALYFLFQLIFASYGIISAGGDSQQISTNRQKITNAILGLSITVAAYAVVGLIANLLGITNGNANIYQPLVAALGLCP